MVIKISDRIVKRKIEGRYFLVDPAGQILHSMNDTATFLFDLLLQGKDTEQMAEALCDEYEIDEQSARQDMAELLQALKDKGVLETD